VNIKNTANLAVKVDFAALNVAAKQGALGYLENDSRPTKAIGMNQPSDADAITNSELKHPEIIPFQKCAGNRFLLRGWGILAADYANYADSSA
jgi:hypothetical protein